jgi:hypothetical protein
MKTIFLLIIIQHFIQQNGGTPSKFNLENLYKKYQFRDSQNSSNKLNLTNEYQLKLLKNRNNECLLKKYATLNESKLSFTQINQTFVDLWKNFNSTSSLNVDDFFDNTVSNEELDHIRVKQSPFCFSITCSSV